MTSVCPLFHVWVRTQSIPSSPSCVLFPCSYFPTLQSDQFFPFIFISWRLITLQYCSVFAIYWHESAIIIFHFSDLDPMQAPHWSVRVRKADNPQCLLGKIFMFLSWSTAYLSILQIRNTGCILYTLFHLSENLFKFFYIVTSSVDIIKS